MENAPDDALLLANGPTETKTAMDQKTQNAESIEVRVRGLHEQLKKVKWPSQYMFKFIMPNDRNTIDSVLEVLPSVATPRFTSSKNGKYTCITCVMTMPSAEAVMDVTMKVCAVKGVMSL